MRPLDVVILLKKLTPNGVNMNGKQVADSLGISAAEVSVAMERNRLAQLVNADKTRINILALKEFLVYGIRYCFPVQPGRIVRGIPTAASASPIKESIATGEDKYVWREPHGTYRGQSVVPLYNKAPVAAQKDPDFYALLAIVDSLRIGKSRERQTTIEELDKYLNQYVSQ